MCKHKKNVVISMKTSNKIILGLYFGLFIWGLLSFKDDNLLNYLSIFIPTFLIIFTPFSNKLREKHFNFIWISISVLFSLIPIISSKMNLTAYSIQYIVPLCATLHYHLIRQIYKIVFRREPIFIGRILEAGMYDREKKRESDAYDLIYSLCLIFGFLGILGLIFLNFKI